MWRLKVGEEWRSINEVEGVGGEWSREGICKRGGWVERNGGSGGRGREGWWV